MHTDLFALPEKCLLETTLPKNRFENKYALTSPEKKLLKTPFLPLKTMLTGSLQSGLSFIPGEKSGNMDYEDVLFLEIQLMPEHFEQKTEAVLKLFQKYIPKPVVLLVYCDTDLVINTAVKRYNEADAGKRSVETMITSPVLSLSNTEANEEAFFKAIRYENIDRQILKTAYHSYVNAISALNRTYATGGHYQPVKDGVEVHRQNQHLRQLKKEMEILRRKIRKSRDIREQIDFKIVLGEKKNQYQKMMQKINAWND